MCSTLATGALFVLAACRMSEVMELAFQALSLRPGTVCCASCSLTLLFDPDALCQKLRIRILKTSLVVSECTYDDGDIDSLALTGADLSGNPAVVVFTESIGR